MHSSPSVSGTTFAVLLQHYPDLFDRVLCVCDVYARMSPDQKQTLVNRLQQISYTVAMCGDGANDCGALKVVLGKHKLSLGLSSRFCLPLR